MSKSHIDWLELTAYGANPTDTDTDRRGLAVVGTTLKLWTGSSWSEVTSGGSGGVSTWDGLYDLDKQLTIDAASLQFTLTHLTNDGLTLDSSGSTTGALLQFGNSGSGPDIQGTSDTWNITKAGAAVLTQIFLADNAELRFGNTVGSSDAQITWNTSLLNIAGDVDFDDAVTTQSTVGVGTILTVTGTAANDSIILTDGDLLVDDGSLTVTDTDNASTVVVTNATLTSGGHLVSLTADAITDKSILYIDNGGASLTTGYYINCNDDGAVDFSVGKDGATVITTAVATTAALTITGIQTSQDMVTFDNTGGVVASGKAVLLLDAGGTVASGGNILRVAPTGTPNAGAIGIEFVGAGKVLTGLKVDTDVTGSNVVLFHGGGALTNGNAVVGITNDGNLATGGALLNMTLGGTPNTAARVFEIDGGSKDAIAMYVDSDAATESAVQITGAGAIATGKAMLEVDNTGTPAAAASNVAHFTFTGTATNNPVVVNVNNSTKDALPLLVTSNVASATREVARFVQDNTGGATPVIALQQDDVSEEFVDFLSTAASGASIDVTNATPASIIGSVMVAYNGTKVRLALYAAAGWSA